MSFSVLRINLLVFLVAAVGAAILARYTRTLNSLDRPNERSSHTVPTPRGGGIAIVVTSTLGVLLAVALEAIEIKVALALIVGGLAVATVGFADDHRGIPTRIRLSVHAGAALWALYVLDGVPALQIGAEAIELNGFWSVVSMLSIVWMLNLFNFMDGIDGFAASEAIFVTAAGSLLGIAMGVASGVSLAAAIVGGSCLGFLIWNWPPAKIFMGDIGSSYLGYIIAILVLISAVDSPVAIWVWLVLGGAFFIDATTTLVRRLARREQVSEAHREHAYQWLARRWESHRPVTMGLMIINVVWLLPFAVWCVLQPDRAAYIVVGAYLPLLIAAVLAGAGRAEHRTQAPIAEENSVDG